MRFKGPISLHQPFTLQGKAGDSWGSYIKATGEVRSISGELLATARAVYSTLPREESARLRAALTFAPDDWDVLDSQT